MMAAMPRVRRAERGMALISALLLLLVVTLMAISMFRSYGMQEKIAGNTREKQRALTAAISAQQYAETLLASGTAPPTAACNALVPATAPQVCNNLINAQGDFTLLPWNIGVIFTPFATNSGNGVMNTVSQSPTTSGTGMNRQESYYQTPNFYITDLGAQAGGKGEVYQIDAVGYGGSPSSVAVVESTYLISTNTAKSPDK